ncbi:MAG: hypothetical protein QY322_01240 [bacterium]|nr:MAG: hypothetical protein QY322_01240 [bacterium]
MAHVKLNPDMRQTAADAVSRLLDERGETGASIGAVKNKITSSLHIAVFPQADFGKILFKARAKKVGDRYYLMGVGPEKPKAEKPAKTGGDEMTFEGVDVVITGQHGFKLEAKKVKRVTIIISSILLILAARMVTG